MAKVVITLEDNGEMVAVEAEFTPEILSLDVEDMTQAQIYALAALDYLKSGEE
jgi:hypothetical protein